MNLQTPDTIRRLQRKLYLKAKAEPDYRFYLLYDKIYREDILHQAYDLMRSNNGAPGVDGVTFEMIEAEGLEEWLSDIRKDLPGPASQGANAWHPPLHIYSGVRRARGAPA
jgi:RNA-directed DNA polymerase